MIHFVTYCVVFRVTIVTRLKIDCIILRNVKNKYHSEVVKEFSFFVQIS